MAALKDADGRPPRSSVACPRQRAHAHQTSRNDRTTRAQQLVRGHHAQATRTRAGRAPARVRDGSGGTAPPWLLVADSTRHHTHTKRIQGHDQYNAQNDVHDCEAGHLDRTDRVARVSELVLVRSDLRPRQAVARALLCRCPLFGATRKRPAGRADLARRDHHEADRVNRRGVQPPERHRRRSLKPPEHKPPHHWTSQRRAVRPFDRGDSHKEIGRQAGAGVVGTVSGAVAVGGSLPPGSSRNGGYESVINVAYATTRKTQRFIPRTRS